MFRVQTAEHLARVALVSVALAACGPASPPGGASSRSAAVEHQFARDGKALLTALTTLDSATARWAVTPEPGAPVQQAFRDARLAYKRVEYLLEYLAPDTIRLINGAAVPWVREEAVPMVAPPHGFQVIEAMIFPRIAEENAPQLRAEVRALRERTERLLATPMELTNARVFEAMRREMFRIVALGLAGADSPVALASLPEAAAALSGIRDGLAPYEKVLSSKAPPRQAALVATLDSAIGVLDTARDVLAFDRLAFITRNANPISRALVAARDTLGFNVLTDSTGVAYAAATLFDAGAFDPLYFAPTPSESYTAPSPTSAYTDLGRALFFDPVLSDANDRSCASCHDPNRAFTDSRAGASPRSAHAGKALRNTPTLINSGLHPGAFMDVRTKYLEWQVASVISTASEMGGDLWKAADRVRARPDLQALFVPARRPTDSVITTRTLETALATYVRSLQALDAPFDRYMRGDTTAMSVAEREGFNVFMGKGHCGTCHFIPLFTGVAPPRYIENEVEVIGVPTQLVTRNATLDPDRGRFEVTRAPPHDHAFATPTLRNVALTAPYMHNGVYRTLEDVIDFYNRGGGIGIGATVPTQTLPADSLRFTATEQRALVAFLGALTDTVGTTRRPPVVPAKPGTQIAAPDTGFPRSRE